MFQFKSVTVINLDECAGSFVRGLVGWDGAFDACFCRRHDDANGKTGGDGGGGERPFFCFAGYEDSSCPEWKHFSEGVLNYKGVSCGGFDVERF